MKNIYNQIHQKIKESDNIAIIWHRFPDGDTMSSMVAMYGIIRDNFESKNVDLVNSDVLPEKLKFLTNWITVNKELIKKYDLYIFVDIWDIKLAWFGQTKDNYKNCFIINIDHHPFNINYWDINLIWAQKASTTEVLYDYFTSENYKISPDAATALLTWIYTDTWAFSYSNTTETSFWISADLLELWWKIKPIVNNFFNNNTFDFIKLLWVVFKRLKISKEWIGISYLKKEDIINSWCKYEELDWIVWRLNKLSNVKYIYFLYEKWDFVKWSLRTIKDDINLAEIAKTHNGWWHRQASAFMYEWEINIDENKKISIKTQDNIINFF